MSKIEVTKAREHGLDVGSGLKEDGTRYRVHDWAAYEALLATRGLKPTTAREGITFVDSFRDELGGEAAMEARLCDVFLHLRRDEIEFV